MRRYPLAAFVAASLLFLLTSCASVGLQPATTVDERIAYAVSQNAAIRQTAANSLDAGDIQLADAQYVLKTTDETRAFLNAAKDASGAGDIKTAEGRLLVATNVLTALQTYLRTKK